MLKRIRQWYMIRKYSKRLSLKLLERYGRQQKYTEAQIRRTIAVCGMPENLIPYAIATYFINPTPLKPRYWDDWHEAPRTADAIADGGCSGH